MIINAKTQLIGLLGWPISHSLSPQIQNAAAQDLGLNWVYVPMPVRPEHIATAVAGLAALGFRGVNVTVPHKQAVIPHLDEITEGAQAVGAVNTIKVGPSGHLTGYNTDWSGFMADLVALGIDVNGRDCIVLGAGGSARAIAFGLARAGAQVQVLARQLDQAIDLVADLVPFIDDAALMARPLQALKAVSTSTKEPLIINTTPVGMLNSPDISIWPEDLPFPMGAFVYDLIYNPPATRFLRQAKAAGIPAQNGLALLLRQGAESFEIWTGQTPDLAVMENAIRGGTA